jgi:hypothetical protein
MRRGKRFDLILGAIEMVDRDPRTDDQEQLLIYMAWMAESAIYCHSVIGKINRLYHWVAYPFVLLFVKEVRQARRNYKQGLTNETP